MPHTKKFMMNLSFCRIMVLSGCLLLNAISLFAQQPDTAKPKRNVLNNILTRVITGNKDTVKPNTNPANNPNNNNPNKPVNNRDVIAQPNRDVIANPNIPDKFAAINRFPDTLIIGAYTIVVESYDKGGEWNQMSNSFMHLNGIGRVKFNCPPIYTIWPGIWKDAILKPVKFTVVDKVQNKDKEISTKDAADLGLTNQPGSEVEVMMPHVNERAIDMTRFLGDVKGIRPKAPEGIRVRFTDLQVSVPKFNATTGNVVSGIARYPTVPAIPAVPFVLNIAAGFQLEVSAISFSPGVDPMFTAKLVLPSSITQNSACAAGRLDLGDFRMGSSCEFYKSLPGSDYGVFGIGNTTLAIGGRGYVADFSSSQSYPASGKPANWKGVVLMQGESKGSPAGTVVSNIGYMQADYTFTNGLVEASGLTATFRNVSAYAFEASQPFGYSLEFGVAEVNVAASQVAGGFLRNGRVALPKSAVREANDSRLIIEELNLAIKNNMDLSGFAIIKPAQGIYWGDLIAAGGGNRKSFGVEKMDRQALLFFAASPKPGFYPTNAAGKKFMVPFNSLSPTVLENNNMQGATFSGFQALLVNTPNIPDPWNPDNPKIPINTAPVWFRLNNKDFTWLNITTEGVNGSVVGDIVESPNLKFGDPSKPLYVGITPFDILSTNPARTNNITFSRITLQCVESAVITCDYRSLINVPEPVKAILAFKEMVFTSTANNAGGKLDVQPNDSLDYWGLKLVPKPGFSSAGLVSVKTGQIVLTAAGLAETRHFAQPFWLTWGEMLANGTMGRLFFDYNSAGQQFDKFNYIHNAVALSPINPDPAKKGFLRVGGTAFFPFFGGDYLHIVDTYTPGMAGDPFNGRTVTLSNGTTGSFLPSDLTIGGNWSDGLGIFNFNIQYASVTQDGFLGTGVSSIRNLLGGDIGSTLDMNSRGTCIRIGTNLMDQRSIALGPVANISNITRIWGCVCIKGDAIENMVVGGEVTNAANMSIAARVGSYLSAILQVNPSLAKITIDGEAYMSLVASLDAEVNGHMQLTMNYAEGFLEGEVQGKFMVAAGSPVLVGGSLQAEGQVNWHLGIDFNELQGMVALKVMGFEGGVGVSAGFYIGENAPKSRAWVMVGEDPRFALNMSAMPDRLTGIYGYFHLHQGINLFVISGDYDIYVGLGAFVLPAPFPGAVAAGLGLPYVVGNLGGRIHGDILGGLVSAGAYFDMQIMGPYPFSFQGTVGLEACVLWVFCGSVDLTIGLNSHDGFYIQ
ncbi:MAG: hypothetical protein IPP73_17275 [Chitinophagaceae bacterium]|nr:hypothetical protein [Chitinophagaceae bacterium]